MSTAKFQKSGQLGTFAGVFTPSVLTILGIILFLRLGYVVGNAGLARALIIIGVANLISVSTSFSLAAIATNMKVKGGGDYYLISRTLGIEFGGAIGIVLFLAQSVSIAFYCIGFGEAVSSILSGGSLLTQPQIIAGLALIFLFILAWIGADLATKFQYVVMTFLVLALVSFYIGGIGNWDTQTLVHNWSSQGSKIDFWILFALFFPAVTGFTQGVSMSGDLKDPGKSLPIGTFYAVVVSIVVYFSVAVIFAAANPLSSLANDYGIMKKTAYFGFFIDAGVIAATLSSAMASFLGAPRILQSLSSDKIFPILLPFAKGFGKSNNPRRAVLLSFAIAGVTIVFGQLDLIAGIVSMFFLISYGLLNYATYFEAAAQSPSFRPRFNWYDKRISLVGFISCMGIMLAIDYKTGLAAAAALFAIYQYIKQTSLPSRWSDSQRSYHLKTIRENLLATQQDLEHPREWRPFILALSNGSKNMEELLDFSALIEGNSGITTAVKILQGNGYRTHKQKENALKELLLIINEKKAHAFPLVVAIKDISIGLPVLFQSFGIGPVRANTILINWNECRETQTGSNRQILKSALQNDCNIVFLEQKVPGKEPVEDETSKTIDVWWKGDDTSRLMILLAYLITRNGKWEGAVIRLFAFHLDRDTNENIQYLNEMLEEIRIEAVPAIILNPDAERIIDISKSSDLVFLPVYLRENRLHIFKETSAEAILPKLKTVALTMAAQKVELDTEPEEGKPGEISLLLDKLRHAEKRLESAEKAAFETTKAANEMMNSVNIEASLANPQVLKSLKEALAARDKAEAATQKTLKERSRMVEIENKVKELGIS